MIQEDMGVAVESSAETIAAPVESVDTATDVSADAGEVTSTGDDSVTSGEKDGLTAKAGQKTGKLDLGTLVKTKSDALKAIDPSLPGELRKMAFEMGSLLREFPGGLKEAVAQKQALAEIGGVEGIKEHTEALGDYQALETLFEKGDPKFMERLADSLPTSFSQIMPAGLEKWKTADPEMYNHVQARVMIQTLDSARVSDTLEQIWNNLDEKTQGPAKESLARIWQTLDGYRQAAAKAPERKTNPQNEAMNKREQDLAERETKALLSPVANEGRRQIETITDREMATSFQWGATDPDIKTAVQERVRQEVVKASQKDSLFTKEFDRLKERGDGAGLSRHVQNFQARVTPAIVQRVARLFAVKPKGAGPAVVKKAAAATNGNGSDQGWTRISSQPSHRDIDYSKTTEDMIFGNKAVLRDKRKVQW